MQNKIFLVAVLVVMMTNVGIAQSNYFTNLQRCNEMDYFESIQCMVGSEIFEFNGRTLDNEEIDFGLLKGKILVLNYWFTACGPCIAELNGLNELVEKYSKNDDIKFISFTSDTRRYLEEEFFPNYKFDFKIIPDGQEFLLSEIKHTWGFPTTIVVGQDGKIKFITTGGSTEVEKASKEIKTKLVSEIEKLLDD